MQGYSTALRAVLLTNWFKRQLSISRLELPITTTVAQERRGGGGGNEEGRGGEGRGRLERANLREGEGRERGGCIAYYRMCAINVHA